MARHVLAGLVALAELKAFLVLGLLVGHRPLELLHAVEVGHGVLFLVVLSGCTVTLVGSLGRPLVLSVLGLMSCPGACMKIGLPFRRVFA